MSKSLDLKKSLEIESAVCPPTEPTTVIADPTFFFLWYKSKMFKMLPMYSSVPLASSEEYPNAILLKDDFQA